MKKRYTILLVFLLTAFFSSAQQVETGIEQLQKQNFKQLEGKRVGLITNPTGVDANLKSTVDILFEAKNVNLVALYGPEHGVRGEFSAGDKVADSRDARTGLLVFSLYGKTRKPSKEMLKNIDILVYDIQDIGSRSYTFISTMGLAMEAAAENNIEFLVLDRPNPLGGERMEGLLTEKGSVSFVSQYPIPYIHGMTCGELALFLNGEKLLTNGVQAKLSVVPMKGWNRKMIFEDTGLPWVPSSPHIPNARSAFFYPMSGILGELYSVNIGVGYTLPFELFASTWTKDAEKLAENLNGLQIEGVIFRPIHYKPYYGEFKDAVMNGVQVHITDYRKIPLTLIQFYVMQEWKKLYPEKNIFEDTNPKRLKMFDNVCGSPRIREAFMKRFLVEDITDLWNENLISFDKNVKIYFLYL